MHIIYLHGLDSCPSATKAITTQIFAQKHGIAIDLPNLNCPPNEVLAKVGALIDNNKNGDTVLIGSSLGGYFAALLADKTGVPCVLLNPSIRPDLSFQRFLDSQKCDNDFAPNTVIYTTTGGWDIQYGDLDWFKQHRIVVQHPERIGVLLKMGDELLDAAQTEAFFAAKGAAVLMQAGGDHRMSDYNEQVAKVLDWAQQLLDQSIS